MKVLSVKKYNEKKFTEYNQDCEKWTPEKEGFPQIAFYFFNKNYGYVAFDNARAVWKRTRKEAVASFNN